MGYKLDGKLYLFDVRWRWCWTCGVSWCQMDRLRFTV
jgi:hypothetical protein